MTNKHEQHVRALQEMRCVMIENDNWENLKRFIEAVTAGGMAIQVLDEKAFTQPKIGHWSRKTKVDAYDIAGVKTWGIKCQCDRCDFTTIVVEDFGYYKFCPNCGARMVEPKPRGWKADTIILDEDVFMSIPYEQQERIGEE